MTTSAEPASGVPEPLLESAPLALALAAAHCRAGPAGGESCAWYHGLWQYLRLLGMVETPAYHAQFFASALRQAPAHAQPLRILISGTADYSMTAHVAAACRALGREAELTVADLCQTPLELNRWYAAREGFAVRTLCADLLLLEGSGFDAIFTHAFLGRFAPAERPALFARWHALLRPGGLLATVTPVRPGAGESAGFDERQVAALRDDVGAAAAARGGLPGIDLDALGAAAERYARRHRVHPVRSAAELRSLLEGAGLRVAELAEVPAVPGVRHAARGPTIVGSAGYARILALRP